MQNILYDFYDIRSLSESDINHALSMMTERQRERVLRFPQEDDRLRSAAAELLGRRLISKYLSIPERSIVIDRLDSGQPFAPGLPCHISLSHSGHLAMAAVSHRPVGSDIEIIADRGPRLLEKVCSAKEQEYILASGNFDRQRFFEIWTAKEAILKHSGRGLSGGMASTVVSDGKCLLREIGGHRLITGVHDNAAYAVYF